MLLEAYGFSLMGTVMLWGAIASFVLAAIMAVLVGLGVWHARRTNQEEQILAPKPVPAAS
jgi:cytochrome oxidase assembly protein ShyY1